MSYEEGTEYELYKTYDSETNTLSDKVDADFYNTSEGSIITVLEEGIYCAKQVKATIGHKLSKDIIKIDASVGLENSTMRKHYFHYLQLVEWVL